VDDGVVDSSTVLLNQLEEETVEQGILALALSLTGYLH
jgi:hypothetical protein